MGKRRLDMTKTGGAAVRLGGVATALMGATLASAQIDVSVQSAIACDVRGRPYVPSLIDGSYFLKATLAVSGWSSPVKVRFELAGRVVERNSSTPAGGIATCIVRIPCPLDGSIPFEVTADPYRQISDANWSNNVKSGSFAPAPPLRGVIRYGRRRLDASQVLRISWGSGTADRLVSWLSQPTSETFQRVLAYTPPVNATTVSMAPFASPASRVERVGVPTGGASTSQSATIDASNVACNGALLRNVSWASLLSLPAGVQPFLQAESTVQSTHASINAFVLRHLPPDFRATRTPYDAARDLYQGVVNEVAYGSGPGTALDTLNQRTGDDTGMSRLYVAALRSIGIPARTVSGWCEPVFPNPGPKWHVWTEFFLPGHGWIPQDPSKADELSPGGQYAFYFGVMPMLNSRIAMTRGSTFTYEGLTTDNLHGGASWYWGSAAQDNQTFECALAPKPNGLLPGFAGQYADTKLAFWRMQNGRVVEWTPMGEPGVDYVIRALGDVDGDGQTDMIGQRKSNFDLAVWRMSGNRVLKWTYLGNPGRAVIKGAADFDGDGKDDLIGQYVDNNHVAVWYMDGPDVRAWKDLGDPGAVIHGAGDFNGDGKPDMLGRYANGDLALWFLDDARVIGWRRLGSPGANVKILGVADFDFDGKADVLGQYTQNRYLAIWYMNGQWVSEWKLFGDPGLVEIGAVGMFTK